MEPVSLRLLVEGAREAAARQLNAPSLYSVLVDLAPGKPLPRIERLQWGFQDKRSLQSGRYELRACWVETRISPLSVTVKSTGTYRKQQLRQLSSIRGLEFPPRDLHLDQLQLEPLDVLHYLQEHQLEGAHGSLGSVDLGLFCHEGTLAWRVLQEVPSIGVRTLFVGATDGRVLYEKLDPSSEAAGKD